MIDTIVISQEDMMKNTGHQAHFHKVYPPEFSNDHDLYVVIWSHDPGHTSGTGLETDVVPATAVLQNYYCCHNMACQPSTGHEAAVCKLHVTTMVTWDIGAH